MGKLNSAADAMSHCPVGPPKHFELMSLSGVRKGWLSMAQNMAQSPTPKEVEEARFLKEELVKRSLGIMIATVGEPMVITWECMVEEARRDPQYRAVASIIKNGGTGTWPAGKEGIKRQRDHLSVIDGVVVFKGRSVVPPSLRRRVLECLHSGHQGVTSMALRARDGVWWPGIEE